MSGSFHTSTGVRRQNRAAILRQVFQAKALTRRELGEITDLTASGLSRILRELIDAGLVIESDPIERKGVVGRRQSMLSIRPEGAFVIGIAITANRRGVALMDASGLTIDRTDIPDADVTNPETAADQLAEAAKGLLRKNPVDRRRIIGAAVSVATNEAPDVQGRINSRVLHWTKAPISELLQSRLNLPVTTTSRASSLIRAELRHLPAAVRANVFLINVGLGIGTAWQLRDVQRFEGRDYGCLGHIPHPISDIACECGRRGCLEHCGSGAAAVRTRIGAGKNKRIPFTEINAQLASELRAAGRREPGAVEAFRTAGRRLAYGIDLAHIMFHPTRIILTGETGRQTDFSGGVLQGLKEMNSLLPREKIMIGSATTVESAALTALNAFLLTSNFDFDKVKST